MLELKGENYLYCSKLLLSILLMYINKDFPYGCRVGMCMINLTTIKQALRWLNSFKQTDELFLAKQN